MSSFNKESLRYENSNQEKIDVSLLLRDTFKEVKEDNEVHHPSHYTDGKIEVIDFIEDKNLDFHLGNAVKYISRAGKKGKDKYIQDLEKALWYLTRKINNLKNIQ